MVMTGAPFVIDGSLCRLGRRDEGAANDRSVEGAHSDDEPGHDQPHKQVNSKNIEGRLTCALNIPLNRRRAFKARPESGHIRHISLNLPNPTECTTPSA